MGCSLRGNFLPMVLAHLFEIEALAEARKAPFSSFGVYTYLPETQLTRLVTWRSQTAEPPGPC